MTDAAPDRSGGLFGWRRWLPRAVFESVLIVFSVFLALALSQWADDRRTARRVDEARRFFADEIALNCNRLASPDLLPHHLRLRDEVQAALDAGRPEQAVEAAFRTGVRPMIFRDAVWRSLSAGELLESMEPREVFALASLYKLQEQLADVNSAMQVAAMQATAQADGGSGLGRSLRLYFGDVEALERELMGMYPQVLTVLDAKSGGARTCAQAAARFTS